MDTRGRARTNKIFREISPPDACAVLQRRAELFLVVVSVIVERQVKLAGGVRRSAKGWKERRNDLLGQFSPRGAGTGSHPSGQGYVLYEV